MKSYGTQFLLLLLFISSAGYLFIIQLITSSVNHKSVDHEIKPQYFCCFVYFVCQVLARMTRTAASDGMRSKPHQTVLVPELS